MAEHIHMIDNPLSRGGTSHNDDEERKKKVPQNMSDVDRDLNRIDKIHAKKDTWRDHFQLIGEFVHLRKQEFNNDFAPGEFLVRHVFDSTAPKALQIASSSLISKLWPDSKRRIRLLPPRSLEIINNDVKKYYEFVTNTLIDVMDNPLGGFRTSLIEYMLDQLSFGTSGIEAMPDKKTKVMYRPWGLQIMSIEQGKNGRVDTVTIKLKKPIHEAVKEYGINNVSKEVRDSFNKGDIDREIIIDILIEPRIMVREGDRGNRALPVRSTHIERSSKHRLRESGFDEMPIKIGRMMKLIDEVYGRSPAMTALPAILQGNIMWEGINVAIEKSLDPPLWVADDGSLGGGEIDTSAGALNVFNLSGRAGERQPIGTIFTVGEVGSTANLIERVDQDIGDHFFIDRLLDFNNEAQMTLGEANLRDRKANETMGSVFARQIEELFTPIIQRTFNILFAAGELGVRVGSDDEFIQENIRGKSPRKIPEQIAEMMERGEDVYEIDYQTPARRIMQAEEKAAVIELVQVADLMAPGHPDVYDNYDADKAFKAFALSTTAPTKILRSDEDKKEIRDTRAEAQKEQNELQKQLAQTEAIRNVGQSGLVQSGAEAI